MKKKFLWIIPVILVLVLVLGFIAYKTAAKNSYANTEGTVFIKKSELTGVYVPLSAEVKGTISVHCDVIRGVMKSPLDPPPLIRVSLTNNTTGVIQIRKKPASGQYGVQVVSEDKNKNYIGEDSNFNIELNLQPKETKTVDVALFSSLETKGFGIFVRYKK